MQDGTQPEPWQWEEAVWREKVAHVRAGRSLTPSRWKDGKRFAVALSFDADHETLELRFGGKSYGKLSQGQYGGRVGTPRILNLLDKYAVPATFFMPAVSAMIHPDEPRRVVSSGHELGIHSWIHEFNSTLPYEAERDLAFRARDVLATLSGIAPVGMPRRAGISAPRRSPSSARWAFSTTVRSWPTANPTSFSTGASRAASSRCRWNGSGTMRCTSTWTA